MVRKAVAMAWAAVARQPVGGAGLVVSIGIRVALIHESATTHEKWDNKWKSVNVSFPCCKSNSFYAIFY